VQHIPIPIGVGIGGGDRRGNDQLGQQRDLSDRAAEADAHGFVQRHVARAIAGHNGDGFGIGYRGELPCLRRFQGHTGAGFGLRTHLRGVTRSERERLRGGEDQLRAAILPGECARHGFAIERRQRERRGSGDGVHRRAEAHPHRSLQELIEALCLRGESEHARFGDGEAPSHALGEGRAIDARDAGRKRGSKAPARIPTGQCGELVDGGVHPETAAADLRAELQGQVGTIRGHSGRLPGAVHGHDGAVEGDHEGAIAAEFRGIRRRAEVGDLERTEGGKGKAERLPERRPFCRKRGNIEGDAIAGLKRERFGAKLQRALILPDDLARDFGGHAQGGFDAGAVHGAVEAQLNKRGIGSDFLPGQGTEGDNCRGCLRDDDRGHGDLGRHGRGLGCGDCQRQGAASAQHQGKRQRRKKCPSPQSQSCHQAPPKTIQRGYSTRQVSQPVSS